MITVDTAGSPVVQAVVDHLGANDILAARRADRRPDGAGWEGSPGQSEYVPYCWVQRIGSTEPRSMNMRQLFDESRVMAQVTCVGGTPEQVDDLVDEVNVLMLNRTIVVPSRRVEHIVYEVGISTSKDPDEAPPLFYGGSRFRVWTLPA